MARQAIVDAERIDRLKAALQQAQFDALILRLPENIVMSMGVWPMNGFSYALLTADAGPAALIAPSSEDQEMRGCWAPTVQFFTWPRLNMGDPLNHIRRLLDQLIRQHRLGRARIGYEGSFEAIAPPHNAGEVLAPCEATIRYLQSLAPDARWSDATTLLHELRATKTAAEIAKLRVAHRVAGYGIEAFHDAVATATSEAALASEVYRAALVRGTELDAGLVNVFPQISSGDNAHRAWRPIVTTGARKLREGELAVLELAVCVGGFWADVTRVKAVGKPREIHQRAFAAVQQAQQTACAAIRAGVPAEQPHEAATRCLIDAGFTEQIVHLTGHGVGFRYHEPEPFLMPGNASLLRTGHVCSVEPGLYDRSWGGIRLEDNIAVTDDGIINLTAAPKLL